MLTFEMGVDSQRVMDYMPVQGPFGGYYYGRHGGHFGWGYGYTAYMPYIDTIYTHWLKMKAVRRQGHGPAGGCQ